MKRNARLTPAWLVPPALTRVSDVIPESCFGRIPQCLDQGAMKRDARWQWSDGPSIRLVLGRVDGPVGIGLVFRAGHEVDDP